MDGASFAVDMTGDQMMARSRAADAFMAAESRRHLDRAREINLPRWIIKLRQKPVVRSYLISRSRRSK